MSALPKLVFSRTLEHAEWANATLVKGELVESVARLKAEPGPDLELADSRVFRNGTVVLTYAPI